MYVSIIYRLYFFLIYLSWVCLVYLWFCAYTTVAHIQNVWLYSANLLLTIDAKNAFYVFFIKNAFWTFLFLVRFLFSSWPNFLIP